MKKKSTFLIAALMLLMMMSLPGNAVGQEKSNLELTFSLTSNPGGWPTTNSTTLTNYTYTLNNVNYTFALKNVKCNSGYLMFTSTAVLGMPQLAGYKLVKVVAHSSSSCSTATRVGISSSSSSASYISGGAYQTWSTQNHDYTYNLTGTSVNTMYYLYVTNKNAQVTSLTLTYEPSKVATPTFSPAAGSYSSTQSVTISSTTGATIYYTTDGTDPRNSSTTSTYSSAITVSESMTIRAYATESGLTDSDVATAEYNIVPPQKLYITSAHGTVAVTANDASVPITDGYYSIPQGANVTLTVTPSSGYIHTGWNVTEGSVTISNNSFTMPSSTVRLTANYEEVVVDNLTAALVNEAASSKTYTDWSGIKIHDAVYAGNSNINDPASNYIQLNTGSPKGIVTTTSGGYAKKVSVTYSTIQANTNNRYLTVYGKNTAYDGPADLYDEDKRGTELGKITFNTGDTSDDLTITGDYQYIGLLASGAMYFEPITITWLPLTFYTVSYTPSYYVSETQIGAVTVSKTSAIAGEIINLTATGMNHYHFNGWTVTGASPVSVTGTTSASFTMPSSNVTVVAAWEEDTKYDIEVDEDSEDYILVDDKSYASEAVLIQITDVPEGEFIDEVTVAKKGGGTVDDVTYIGQEGDYYNYTFTMPAEAVTVSVSFKDPETYTVSYYVKGELDKSENYTEGNSVTLPTSTTTVDITGFTLLGWSVTEGGTTTLPAGTYYPSGDVDLYAVLGVVSNTSLTITKDTKNFPDSYGTANTFTEYTLEGKKFKIQQGYVNGTKLQWRASGNSNGTGTMYNNENFGKITSIILVYDESDSNKNFTVKAGTSENPTGGTSITGTMTGNVVTFDLSESNYTHFVLTNGSNAGYLSSITINYEESASVSTVTEYEADDDTRSTDIEASECVIVKGTGILTFTGSNKGNTANLIIEDGGQLICNNSVAATVKKTVAGYDDGSKGENDGWKFIASPIAANVDPTTVTNLINETPKKYDLYRLNMDKETPGVSEWENYKNSEASHYHFNLENGRGYLYANADGVDLAFSGAIQPSDDPVEITGLYDGYNLVGNPFTCNASLSTDYYTLNNDGSAIVVTEAKTAPIAPCTGVIIEDDEVTFTPVTGGELSPGKGNVEMVLAQNVTTRGESTTQTLDNAIVSFNEGSQLGKFYFGSQDANLYIPQDNEEYAIVSSSAQGEMPVNFKAHRDGQYTITVNPQEVEMGYLHLIDNIGGKDIDLLATPSYTFNAKADDYESRFRLVFSANMVNTDLNDDFAFFSNGQLVIANEGESLLQVIDVNGRIVMTESVNGTCSKAINVKAGVYVLRLIQGTDVKTQKIIVK